MNNPEVVSPAANFVMAVVARVGANFALHGHASSKAQRHWLENNELAKRLLLLFLGHRNANSDVRYSLITPAEIGSAIDTTSFLGSNEN